MNILNKVDSTYHNLLETVLAKGNIKKDRTGVGTVSRFSHEMRFDLGDGFPLLTTKYVHYPAVWHELLWFLKGGTDIQYLVENGVKIWNDWPYEHYCKTPIDELVNEDCVSDPSRVRRHFTMEEYQAAIKSVTGFSERHGQVGKVYGAQWVNWTWPRVTSGGIDAVAALDRVLQGKEIAEYYVDGYNQITKLIDTLKKSPDSRRMLVTAWNPPEMDECALPCCHFAFQCYTREGAPDGKRFLDLKFHMRSVDCFLGMPFDIASHALLTHMLAQVCGMVPGELIVTSNDTHIYRNHLEQVNLQLSRSSFSEPPRLLLNDKVTDIFAFKYDDIQLVDYKYHPAIKAPIAV